MRSCRTRVLAPLAWLLAGCGGGGESLPVEDLMDPATCNACHPDHVREWSGSMHAYAADDPVFLAMNARGQRETNGELGDFCVSCHAPMAVRTGATEDGLNLADVDPKLKGVTCYFCHNVDQVDGSHNNPLRLANDTTMRGGIDDPVTTDAHRSAYSPLHDRNRLASSDLCGSCHDIVTPAGVHLERTYQEWQGTFFSHEDSPGRASCSSCHMTGRDGMAADVAGVPERRIHGHTLEGVDIALTPWPEADTQRELVQRALDTTVAAELCVDPATGTVSVSLENVAAGHSWPSGAAQDRKAWVEVVAYDGEDVLLESGVLEQGVALATLGDDVWRFGDTMRDADGAEVHMFWEAASVVGELLPGPTALTPFDPGYTDPHRFRDYPVSGTPDRVTLKVHIRPMDVDVLDDLVASGDLDASVRDAVPTFTLGATELEWRADAGVDCVP